MVFEWKMPGMFKTEADVAGKVCEELENTVGLTRRNLVDASREENAPLHNEFEWDDSVAAEKYREEQAGVIIRNLVIRTDETKQQPVRAYFTLDASPQGYGVYESIHTIMIRPEKTTALLDRALQELKSFRSKYAALKELADVFEIIDRRIQTENE